MSLDAASHKVILVRILKDLFTDPEIGPLLGFKGGTAALLFYGLDRFSVDLDLDLLDHTKKDFTFERVNQILARRGVIKRADKKRYSLTYILAYEEKQFSAQNVKVEINLREFGSRFDIKSYLGIPMKVMVREDMFAHKLVTMAERIGKTNRDLYDVCFFFKSNWRVNTSIVEARTEMPYPDFLDKCIILVEKTPNRSILSGIGELLDEQQKVWAKNHLRDELLFQLKLHREILA